MSGVEFSNGDLYLWEGDECWRLGGVARGYQCHRHERRRNRWRPAVPMIRLGDGKMGAALQAIGRLSGTSIGSIDRGSVSRFLAGVDAAHLVISAAFGHWQFLALEAMANIDGAERFLADEVRGAGTQYVKAAWHLARPNTMSRRARLAFFRAMMSEKRSRFLSGVAGRDIPDGYVRLLGKIAPLDNFRDSDLDQLLAIVQDSNRFRQVMALRRFSVAALEPFSTLPDWLLTPRFLSLLSSRIGAMRTAPEDLIPASLLDAPEDRRRAIRQSLEDVPNSDSLAHVMAKWEKVLKNVAPLPAPPFPGDERLRPLMSWKDLETEGREMDNCVGDRADAVRDGSHYYYSWHGEERATVLVLRSAFTAWRMGKCLGRANRRLRQETLMQIQEAVLSMAPEANLVARGRILEAADHDAPKFHGLLSVEEPLKLVREAGRSKDSVAVALFHHNDAKLGYIPGDQASKVAALMDEGVRLIAIVAGLGERVEDLFFAVLRWNSEPPKWLSLEERIFSQFALEFLQPDDQHDDLRR